jgi:ferrous iron transport protein A
MTPLGLLSPGESGEIMEVRIQGHRGYCRCHNDGRECECGIESGREKEGARMEDIGMNLARLQPGQKGRITSIGAIGPLKRRLMDMGVLVGEEVAVVKVAPLGDPIEVRIKSYSLSLRKREAEGIGVEVSP